MLDRLERIVREARERGLSQEDLAREAGLSSRFLGTALSRARKAPTFRPDHESLVKLARAARVSVRWLEDGAGDPTDTAEAPTPTIHHRSDPPKAAAIALVEALRRHPDRYEPEDFLEALRLLDGADAMLPADRERAVQSMASLLGAVARLRREGRPVSMASVVFAVTDAAANAEGVEELRALGAEPPSRVLTPPIPVRAVVPKRP